MEQSNTVVPQQWFCIKLRVRGRTSEAFVTAVHTKEIYKVTKFSYGHRHEAQKLAKLTASKFAQSIRKFPFKEKVIVSVEKF